MQRALGVDGFHKLFIIVPPELCVGGPELGGPKRKRGRIDGQLGQTIAAFAMVWPCSLGLASGAHRFLLGSCSLPSPHSKWNRDEAHPRVATLVAVPRFI